MIEIPYPVKPAYVDNKVTEPSTEFKREVTKVLASILLFILVYFLLMTSAIGLALLSGFGGIMLIGFHPSFITLMLGLGLIGLGMMVLFFLIKFLFKKVTIDRSHLIEIKRKDQPYLFAFVDKLTNEIGAPFPKRIYLSADVNACVFYDSGFWSMFLPVRKNLQIGLGLVNATNMSEFKAVLAHEFGHFSQRSMKLGSYVYNVNQVIFNMLYDNAGYGQALETWGNLSSYFAIFSNLTAGIVQGIQSILQQMYGFINKNYMSLSQQMEFHADAVAASVAGGNHLVSALRRLNMADNSYQRLLQVYNTWVRDNLKAENMYPHHQEVMMHFATDLAIPIAHGLPQIDETRFKQLSASRITIKDQWASHPSTEDRAAHLQQLKIDTDAMHLPAWSILAESEKIQKQMTDLLYASTIFAKTPTLFSESIFNERYYAQVNRYKFNPVYKGYYDFRPMMQINFNQLLVPNANAITDILTEELLSIPQKLEVLTRDIQTLETLRLNTVYINTFELDGKRFFKADISMVLDGLETEKKMFEGQLVYADGRIAALAYGKAAEKGMGGELQKRYSNWETCEEETTQAAEFYNSSMNIMRPAYEGQITIESAYAIDNQLKLKEKTLKEKMQKMIDSPENEWELSDQEKQIVATYIKDKLSYFTEKNGFDNNALNLFTSALTIFYQATANRGTNAKREVLDWQIQFIE